MKHRTHRHVVIGMGCIGMGCDVCLRCGRARCGGQDPPGDNRIWPLGNRVGLYRQAGSSERVAQSVMVQAGAAVGIPVLIDITKMAIPARHQRAADRVTRAPMQGAHGNVDRRQSIAITSTTRIWLCTSIFRVASDGPNPADRMAAGFHDAMPHACSRRSKSLADDRFQPARPEPLAAPRERQCRAAKDDHANPEGMTATSKPALRPGTSPSRAPSPSPSRG